MADPNCYYRGTSPHCLHCVAAAAEATGLLLQVLECGLQVCFFADEISGDGADRDVQVALRSCAASAVATGLPMCAVHGAGATGLHRAGVLCGAAQCLCVCARVV